MSAPDFKVISVYLYQFHALSTEAKERAREWFRGEDYPDYNWWEDTYQDATEVAKFFGVEIDKICFSGFWSQGDGACFTGTFRSDDLKTLDELKENYPTEEKLHTLLQRLLALAPPENTGMKITANGYYSHSNTMDLDDVDCAYSGGDFSELRACLRSFADWIYAQLGKQYEYLRSDECVDENIINNEYWFLVDGTRCTLGDD